LFENEVWRRIYGSDHITDEEEQYIPMSFINCRLHLQQLETVKW
jgi:hypothetical protein